MSSIQLELKIPSKMLDNRRYDYVERFKWWVDPFNQFIEGFEERTGMWEYSINTQHYAGVTFDFYDQFAYFRCGVSNWEKFLTVHNLKDKYPTVLNYYNLGKGFSVQMIAVSNSHRSRSWTLEYEDYGVSWAWNMDEANAELADKWLNEEIKELKDFVKDLIEQEFSTLLKILEKKYDYLTSDEFLSDNITDEDVVQYCLDNDEPLIWESQPLETITC